MNKNINIALSNILGSFWESLFPRQSFVSWVKNAHYKLLKNTLHKVKHVEDSVHVDKNPKRFIETEVAVPVTDCSISSDRIESYPMSGYVQKSKSIKTVLIPNKWGTSIVYIISGKDDNCIVFCPNINMTIDQKYIELYLPASSDLYSDAIYTNYELCNSYIFTIVTSSPEGFLDNKSYITGQDISNTGNKFRSAVWRSYVQGIREYDVREMISLSIYNDIADKEDTVQCVWRECSNYYICTVSGTVYSGKGMPLVTRGDFIHKGDFLFSGVYCFNSDNIPHPIHVPSIPVNTSYGQAEALNAELPLIYTGYDYIPDLCNKQWESEMSKSAPNRPIMIHESYVRDNGDTINPAEYVINYVLPKSTVMFNISDSAVVSTDLANITAKVVGEAKPSSGSCIIYRSVTPDPCALYTISNNTSCTATASSVSMQATISVKHPIVSVL